MFLTFKNIHLFCYCNFLETFHNLGTAQNHWRLLAFWGRGRLWVQTMFQIMSALRYQVIYLSCKFPCRCKVSLLWTNSFLPQENFPDFFSLFHGSNFSSFQTNLLSAMLWITTNTSGWTLLLRTLIWLFLTIQVFILIWDSLYVTGTWCTSVWYLRRGLKSTRSSLTYRHISLRRKNMWC